MTTTTSVELIPREILFGNPDKTSPQISPDGTMMAYLAPVNNVLNVWVGKVGSDDYQPVTKDEDRGVRFYFWAQDNKHIMYIQDVGGSENWRLYATNLESRETRDLTLTSKNPGNIMGWVTDAHFKVRGAIASLPDGGTELLARDNENAGWRKLVSWSADDSLTSAPLGFTLDGQSMYLQHSRNTNAGRLVKLDIATGDVSVIAEDPQYDVGAVMVHPD